MGTEADRSRRRASAARRRSRRNAWSRPAVIGALSIVAAFLLVSLVTIALASRRGAATAPSARDTDRARTREPAPGLSVPLEGEPENVLFVLPAEGGRKALVARFMPGGWRGSRVTLFELRGTEPERLLVGPRGFPSFVGAGDAYPLVRWVKSRMGAEINHIVEVNQACWPQYAWNADVERNPLLEMAAAFPGCLRVTLPPTAFAGDGLERSVETDRGLSLRSVLAMLRRIEGARQRVDLETVPYDGSRTLASLGMTKKPVSGDPWSRELAEAAGSPPQPQVSEVPGGNCLVTFEPDSIRGKLPAASPPAVIERGNPGLMRVALTVDDGWSEDPRIVELLKSWRIKFTAFIVGSVAERQDDLVRRVYEAGGEVCGHTYTHRVMKKIPGEVFLDELWRTQQVITRVTHEVFPYVRYSGGAFDSSTVAWASQEGFWVVNWTIDSLDTRKGVSADAQVEYILRKLQPGAIILCHFGGYHTYDVLQRVIPEIQRRGYEVTSLSRALEGTPFLK